jgi:hypothetical protein
MEDPSFVITPGLSNVVVEFNSHIKVSKGKPILALGPSGSGKSLLIEVFRHHNISLNPKDPFVVINCPAFPETLIESELFGHDPGAFTGARKERIGWLEIARNGAIVLEEIGELQKHVQAKLLIFLQTGEFSRLGSSKRIKSEAKILGVTNREHKPGTESPIREDFWYRFSHFFIHPLHMRRADILYLLMVKHPQIFRSLTFIEILFLLAYNWPGNVRELDSIALNIYRLKNIVGDELLETHSDSRFFLIDRYQNPFRQMYKLYYQLVENLDPYIVTRYARDLSAFNHERYNLKPFKDILPSLENGTSKKKETSEKDKNRLDIPKLVSNDLIRAVYSHFKFYCAVFHLDPSSNSNLLDLEASPISESFHLLENALKDDDDLLRFSTQIYHQRLSKAAPQLVANKSVNEQELQPPYGESEGTPLQKVKDFLAGIKQHELLKLYHEILLERTGGIRSKAAEMAGISVRQMQKSNPTGRRNTRRTRRQKD